MKKTVLKATLLAAMVGASGSGAMAADYRANPFTLAYDGAIVRNEPGKVNIHAVHYMSVSYTHLTLPTNREV